MWVHDVGIVTKDAHSHMAALARSLAWIRATPCLDQASVPETCGMYVLRSLNSYQSPNAATELLTMALEQSLMLMSSGGTDEYQKESHEWISPLSLDRANGKGRLSSGCRLLRLPVELLGAIVEDVPWSALFSFALTCRDACALARSRLFADVTLDYSVRSRRFLGAVCAEARAREHSGSTKLPSIGACVRELVVATRPLNVNKRHGVHPSNIEALVMEERQRRSEEGAAFHYGPYFAAIAQALQSGLPRLTVLRWYDQLALPPFVLGAISCSSVQDLSFFHTNVDEDVDLEEYLEQRHVSARIPLRILDFTLSLEISIPERRASLTRSSLLCLSAPTLERLSWSGMARGGDFHLPASLVPTFSRLRELRLSFIGFESFNDPGYYMALIPKLSRDRMRILEVNPDRTAAAIQFFGTRGKIWSLEAFIWPRPPGPNESEPFQNASGGIEFLEANSHITKLQLAWETHPLFLHNHILPLVTNSFDRLKSLSLIWASNDIPSSSLQMLGQIATLEQLHISAGCQMGWRHSWLINHRVVRKALQPLQQLKVFAISRDSYNPGLTREAFTDEAFQEYIDCYYSYRLSDSIADDLNTSFLLAAGLSPDDHDEDEDSSVEEQGDHDHHQTQSDENNGSPVEEHYSHGGHEVLQPDQYEDSDELTDEEPDFFNLDDGDEEAQQDNQDQENEIWERKHADRMLKHAARYFGSFPQLEHLYIGQLPIDRGLLLASGRNYMSAWLRTTFGWPYDCN